MGLDRKLSSWEGALLSQGTGVQVPAPVSGPHSHLDLQLQDHPALLAPLSTAFTWTHPHTDTQTRVQFKSDTIKYLLKKKKRLYNRKNGGARAMGRQWG